MPQSSISSVIIPTGGGISVNVVTASGGTVTIARATSGVSGLSNFTTLYSGPPLDLNYGTSLYLDVGDQLPGNVLLPNSQYVYQLTDDTGTYTTPALTPVSQLQLDRRDITPILISLLQGAINATALPTGINFCRVLQAMPINGAPPMPFVVINPDLVQQADVPIGVSAINLGGQLVQPGQVNIYTQPTSTRNVFRISIFSITPTERDFYRDLVLAVFRISLISVFQSIGMDWRHDFQASSFQTTTSKDGQVPGFYACDVMLTLEGTTNVTVITTYGIIETIDTNISGYPAEDVARPNPQWIPPSDPNNVVDIEIIVPLEPET